MGMLPKCPWTRDLTPAPGIIVWIVESNTWSVKELLTGQSVVHLPFAAKSLRYGWFQVSTWPLVSCWKGEKKILLGKPFINIYGKPFGPSRPFSPSRLKHTTLFPHFSIFAPPIHLTSHGCFGKSLYNGQLVCTLPGKLCFFPSFGKEVHCILWKLWV